MPRSPAAIEREIASLAGRGEDADTFSLAAMEVLRDAVPFDGACLARTDPATALLTGARKLDVDDARDDLFAVFEYGEADVNLFLDLARRDDPVGVLSRDAVEGLERSDRWREFLVPLFGFHDELRAVFRDEQGRAFGGLALFRGADRPAFSPAEAAFVGRMSPWFLAGLRAGLVAGAASRALTSSGPAVVVVGADGSVSMATPAADAQLEQIGGSLDDLPLPFHAVVGAARRLQAGRSSAVPRLRVRGADGGWLVVHAAPLLGGDGASGRVAVTLEPARAPEVLPLVVAALGLTPRETEVVQRVLRGESTQEIGRGLHLSPYTVQDHLKAVFDKAGVRSRRELIGRVFADHYGPRWGAEVGTEGGLER
jgi:DNA-binding CsgD family transcriptional regulator